MSPDRLIPLMLTGERGFHMAEWIPEGEDAGVSRWIPTTETRHLSWLMRSSVAKRCDLSFSAVPFLHDGSRLMHAHGAALWVRTESGESAKRLASFKPEPTLVIREGATNRMVAFWALGGALAPDDIERANRRLSYALLTAAKWCKPGFMFHPPGVILRHGRARPVPVVVESQTEALYPVSMTRHLKDRPLPPDPSEWKAKK